LILPSEPVGGPSQRRVQTHFRSWGSDAALYLFLLLLVWGLTVPMRGLWQDDTLLLRHARMHQGHGWTAALEPAGSPLRRLYTLPYRLALETPQIVWTLHLVYGALWLGHALAAGWLAGLLLPGRRLIRFLAICLTLTATSDYLTNNLVAVGYNFGALLLLLALGCCLRFVTGAHWGWLATGCASAAASIWTIDVAIPALPFVPLLLFAGGGRNAWKRILVALAALGVALAPAVSVEWAFLHDPAGYAAVAIRPMDPMARAGLALQLWLENFAPWRWVFQRPVWFALPRPLVPLWILGAPAAVASAWFAFRALREATLAERVSMTDERDSTTNQQDTMQAPLLASIFVLMALAANAAYASLQFADIHYRTHIVSRVWASLAVAILTGWAIHRWSRFRAAIVVVPVLFIGFGVWGGLERQNLWVSHWRAHKKELLSMVNAAPAFKPQTGILLRSGPAGGQYRATEANYLAKSWLILLYDDPEIHALRTGEDRGITCSPTPDGLDCWNAEEDCHEGSCPADRFPYETLVILDFDPAKGTWRLVTDPRGDEWLGSNANALSRYRPAARILNRPLTPRQRALLLE
jgi:hypothetical protein